ncbi:MAG: hypothetical protein MZW92_32860 [Comamonadaceae bacterium]|nr:hypothetical protein [Comamonadaceae bacterium]
MSAPVSAHCYRCSDATSSSCTAPRRPARPARGLAAGASIRWRRTRCTRWPACRPTASATHGAHCPDLRAQSDAARAMLALGEVADSLTAHGARIRAWAVSKP